MKALVNRLFLTQTDFDSAMPSGSAVLARHFEREGNYDVALVRNNKVHERTSLHVKTAPAERADTPPDARAAPPRDAVNLDPRRAAAAGRAAAGGAHGAAGRMGVVLLREAAPASRRRQPHHPRQEKEFDSRRLDADCVYAVTLVRPGTYSLTNEITRAKARLTVTYPHLGREPYRHPAPVTIECGPGGFKPDALTLSPGQGVIFHFSTESRIKIELVEPDDGPYAKPGPRAGWMRPPQPPDGQ